MKTIAAAALVLALCPALSHGAPIYRCGQSYSQTPCPGGKLIDAADPRSAAQRAEARRTAQRERQLADQLERDRQKQDATTPRSAATGIDAKAPAAAASQPVPAKSKKKKGGAKAAPPGVTVIVPKGTAPTRP
jgi:hypothetical protein